MASCKSWLRCKTVLCVFCAMRCEADPLPFPLTLSSLIIAAFYPRFECLPDRSDDLRHRRSQHSRGHGRSHCTPYALVLVSRQRQQRLLAHDLHEGVGPGRARRRCVHGAKEVASRHVVPGAQSRDVATHHGAPRARAVPEGDAFAAQDGQCVAKERPGEALAGERGADGRIADEVDAAAGPQNRAREAAQEERSDRSDAGDEQQSRDIGWALRTEAREGRECDASASGAWKHSQLRSE